MSVLGIVVRCFSNCKLLSIFKLTHWISVYTFVQYPSSEHGDVMLSGTTVIAGECYGQVLRTGVNTEIGKATADILQDKSVRIVSVFQQKIMTVVQILISASLG
jgi:magnesium-transporting ATPase (P-type)